MKILFTENGWDDYLYWHQTDRRLQQQINKLIEAITRDPFQGIGKPEPLKHQLTGSWSRRINQEHRLILPCHRRHD